MSCTAQTLGCTDVSSILPLLLSLEAQGLSSGDIAERTGMKGRTIRQALQRWHEREDDDAPLPPLSNLPRRSGMDATALMPPPLPGRAGMPGYEAWELIHAARLDVRAAARRLGLRYPSEVFGLLEQHKLALEADAVALAVVQRRHSLSD